MNARQAVTTLLLSVLLIGQILSAEVTGVSVPGSLVRNQAQISYIDSTTGEEFTSYSNVAELIVTELYRFSLVDNQQARVQQNTTVQLVHQIHNTGNVADSYLLALNQISGAFELETIAVREDINGNGIADAGELQIDRTPMVQPGGVVQLLVTGTVPESALETAEIQLELGASSAYAELETQIVTDTISVVSGVDIELALSNQPECNTAVFPGERIAYNIEYTNHGEVLPRSREYLVDGVERNGVILASPIPANTALDKTELPRYSSATGQVVVRLSGASAWSSFFQWDGESVVESIGLLLTDKSFSPQLRGFFNFSVKSNELITAETRIDNQASVDLTINGQTSDDETLSNPVCNSFAMAAGASAAELRFVEPIVSLRQSSQAPEFDTNAHFTDAPFYRIERATRDYVLPRDGVYLELRSTSLNRSAVVSDGQQRDLVKVLVRSSETGDTLQVSMLETGPNTGVFRSSRTVRLREDVAANGATCPAASETDQVLFADYERSEAQCVLKSTSWDTLIATFFDEGSGLSLRDEAVVDPFGIVFDSQTLLPVPGAIVRVVESNGNEIFDDPVTGAQLELSSGENGRYELPRLEASSEFYLDVVAPPGYSFPSIHPPAQFETYRVGPFSYGLEGFEGVSGIIRSRAAGDIQVAPLAIDIPLDPAVSDSDLLIEKRALQTETAPGEFTAYEIDVRNAGDTDLNDAVVIDSLPYGYRFVTGSAAIGGQRIDDPQKADGNAVGHLAGTTAGGVTQGASDGATGLAIRFELGTVVAGTRLQLSYLLEATAGALDSDGINRAVAQASDSNGAIVLSPQASAAVSIRRDGVLADRAIVFGKVFLDSDCDYLQSNGEWPIGGVKLYLQDGTFVITDEDGLYSLYGLAPGNYVIKVDPLTLPEHLQLKPLDTRSAADADSRFVDLRSGDFHRADFAASCPSSHVREVVEELKKRSRAIDGTWLLEEAVRFNPDAQNPADRSSGKSVDADGDISNGFVSGPANSRNRAADSATSTSPVRPQKLTQLTRPQEPRMPLPKQQVASITAQQAKNGTWLWPQGEISKDGRFMAVVRAGITPILFVNGQPVSGDRIGEQIVNKAAKAQVVAWYGVKLRAGVNQIEVRGKDPFGNTRVMAKKSVKRPTSGTRLVIRARKDTIAADGGRSVLPLEINIVDDNDYPALGVYFVTLESSDGAWQEPDLQDREPGHQIKVENGRALVHYRSSEFTGNVDLRAVSGSMLSQLRIVQVAAARPLIGVGLVEAGGLWSRSKADQFSPTAQADELDGTHSQQARVAMFLKGRVKGDMQLTLSYDSEKDSESELLRDVNPNKQYAVHGDASIRGFEAQSRSKLYAKLEKGKNSLLWGDYLTDSSPVGDDLGRVQRVLTGINAVFDNGSTRVQAFAARPKDVRRVEELPGNGTAMLFKLAGAPIVPNSEVVELVTRDVDNPGIVVASTRLIRLNDYVIDSVTGQIKFARPIPTFDEGLGRNHLRISYDQQTGGQEYTVAGLRLHQRVMDDVVIGFSHTIDENPLGGNAISSAWFEYNPGDRTRVGAGIGFMRHEDGSVSGRAQRVNIEHTWSRKKGRHTSLTWARASEGFNNAGAGISADREELRVEHHQAINNTTNLKLQATHSEALSSNVRKSSASLEIDKAFKSLTGNVGLKTVQENDGTRSDSYHTANIGLEKRFVVDNKTATVSSSYERSLTGLKRERFDLATTVGLHEHLNVYSRYEYQDRLANIFTAPDQRKSETLVVGVESDVIRSSRLYSEYRSRGINGDRELESGTGYRGNYTIQQGVSLIPAVEIVNVLKGDQSEDAVATSLTYSHRRNPNSRTHLHGELRISDESKYYGLRGSYAARLNLDWSFLLRDEITHLVPEQGEITSHHSFTTALSRRPKLHNRHHMLFMYNWKKDYTPDAGGDRSTHIFSTHQNYEFSRFFELSGRAGGKWQKAELSVGAARSNAFLFDTRFSWDISRRFDLDIRSGALLTGNSDGIRYSFGFGASYLLNKNLRMGVGYNFTGFKEKDLDPDGYNAHGFHFGLQYKFDEDLFRWLAPD